MPKFILNCALTGNIHIPSVSPYVPITPADIAAQAVDAANAGASVVHVHGRNPENGAPSADLNIMGEIVSRIKARSDIVINITTSGGAMASIEERVAVVPRFKPELASFNQGTMNFGIFPMASRIKEFKHDWEKPYLESSRDWIFRNTFGDLEKIAKIMKDNGTKPEMEIYDLGHIYNAQYVCSQGLIEDPPYFQAVMGILGGVAASIPHFVHMKETLDKLMGAGQYYLSAIGAGKEEFAIGVTSMLLGGGCRVGLEDNLWLAKGEMAKSNAELVAKMVRVAREFGYEPASPDETRQMLRLKGKDKVAF
jgi:uncharacterized protein (DUF849 family)